MPTAGKSKPAMSRKARRKARKRARDEAEKEERVEAVMDGALEAKPDEALFVVDKAGGKAGDKGVLQAPRGRTKFPRADKALLQRAEKSLVRARKRQRTRKSVTAVGTEELRDLWAEDEVVVVTKRGGKRRAKRRPKVAPEDAHLYPPISHRPKKLDRWHASKIITAVQAPHPGTSVNPEVDAHQDALGEAVAAELAATEHGTGKAPSNMAFLHRDASFYESGEESSSDSDADSDEDKDGASAAAIRAVRHKKFNRAKRNKMARRKAAEAEQAAQEEEAKQHAAIERAKKTKAELRAEQEDRALRRSLRKQAREERLSNPIPIIGGKKVVLREALDVALTEELVQSGGKMRKSKLMTVQGLVQDRFRQYKKRSMFETGRHTGKRKAKTKVLLPK